MEHLNPILYEDPGYSFENSVEVLSHKAYN